MIIGHLEDQIYMLYTKFPIQRNKFQKHEKKEVIFKRKLSIIDYFKNYFDNISLNAQSNDLFKQCSLNKSYLPYFNKHFQLMNAESMNILVEQVPSFDVKLVVDKIL